MWYRWIGEALLFVVGLPLFAFQTVESLQGLMDVFAQISQYLHFK